MNAPSLVASVPSASRVYNVILRNKETVDTYLAKLGKRLERKGLPALVWTWGKAFTVVETRTYKAGSQPAHARVIAGYLYTSGVACDYHVDVIRVPLTFVTTRAHFAGWSFVATLQHLDGENIVRTVPGCMVHDDCRQLPEMGRACAGVDLPAVYRTRGPVCDHCKLARRRNDTYVLHHFDGRYVQVGSTCIADFLGSDEAESIAIKAEVMALAASSAEGAEHDGSEEAWSQGHAADRYGMALGEYLAIVAWCVRTQGWTSRTAARDTGALATANLAWTLAYDGAVRERIGFESTDEDKAHGAAAEAWTESLSDESVNAGQNDYLHNVRAIARTGLVCFRTAGLAASMVTTYERAMGRERAKNERAARPRLNVHLGTVGDRVAFGSFAPKKLAKKIVRLDASPVTLDFVTGYDTEYGYTTVCKFRTAEGACVVWKASGEAPSRDDVGKKFTLVGTVKKHDDYKGELQTLLTRCDVTEVES